MPTEEEDEDYFVPPQDQRVFGAGINRKSIAFVPASSQELSVPLQNKQKAGNLSDRYLAIVLPGNNSLEVDALESSKSSPKSDLAERHSRCTVCQQPLSSANNQALIDSHEATIAHQVCLEHSYPPSHLDRDHVGLKYLSEYGWNPDSRKGLGARLDGIRIPIKAKVKKDTVGLREQLEEDDKTQKKKIKVKEGKPVKLNAKEVRKHDDAAKRRAEKLRSLFYSQDLEPYLGKSA